MNRTFLTIAALMLGFAVPTGARADYQPPFVEQGLPCVLEMFLDAADGDNDAVIRSASRLLALDYSSAVLEREILVADTYRFMAYGLRGEAYYHKRLYATAQLDLESALEHFGRIETGVDRLATIHPAARAAQEKLMPLRASISLNCAVCYLHNGNAEKAQPALEAAIRLLPDHDSRKVHALRELGRLYLNKSEIRLARLYVSQALRLAPNDEQARSLQAKLDQYP